MRINKLTLNNIFSYKDKVTFNFETDHNIYLIIGENGFGKTSFINSLKIALHGITRELLQIGETKLSAFEYVTGSKEKHFSGIMNRVASLSGTTQCSVVLAFVHNNNRYELTRSYKLSQSTYTEELTIKNLKSNTVMIDDEAQDFINAIISPTLAKFFFFDGEKVQNIANFSNDDFKKMLEDVLELNVYDQIIHDYTVLKNEYIKESISDKTLRARFEDATRNIESAQNIIKEKNDEVKNTKEAISLLSKELTTINSKTKKLNSAYAVELENANTALSQFKVEKELKQELFNKIAMSCLPLLLNKELSLKTEFDILNNYYDSNYIPVEVLKRKKVEFMNIINEKLKNGEGIEEIFDSVFFSERKGIRVPFVDTSKVEFQYKSLDLDVIAFSALLDNLIELESLINEQNKAIEKIYESIKENENILNELIKEQQAKSHDKIKKEAYVEFLGGQIQSAQDSIDANEKEIQTISIAEHKESLHSAAIDTCSKIIQTAISMKDAIKAQKRVSLETRINEKFKCLTKDTYEAERLCVSEDFTINVFNKEGFALDILSCSSGQKQIIATSLIWAIGEYINVDMPMVVDTPLGRLDDKNQKLLLERFYPYASRQIIILPTPSELKAEGFMDLCTHANLYTLSNNGSIATVSQQNSIRNHVA